MARMCRLLNFVRLLRVAACGLLLTVAMALNAHAQRTSSWLPGTGFFDPTGFPLANLAAETAKDCRDLCLQNDKCKAWDFDTRLSKPCSLYKTTVGQASGQPHQTGGVITTTSAAPPSAAAPTAPDANTAKRPSAPPSPTAQQANATPPAAAPAPPAPAPSVVAAATPPQVLPSTAGRRVALVIGQSAYQFAPQLPNPANDASDVAAALRKLNFDVVLRKDVDRRGFDDAVREFGKRLDNADLALFFYAGHGLQVGGKNFLVPVDAKLERAGDLALDAVEVGTVLAQMEQEKRVNLVLLDACRDNPLARSLARSLGTRSASVGQGLTSIQSAVGTMIAYSTQPDNVALDGDGRNSPFTSALLNHLGDPGIDISVVMRRVRADVVATTHARQVPWDHSSLIGDVVLAR